MATATADGTARRKARARKPTNAKDGAKDDAVSLLKSDHRAVEKLFAQYEKMNGIAGKRALARRICRELVAHTLLEEEIFYPACRKAGVEDGLLDAAQVEHDGAKVMIADLLHEGPGADYYDAKVSVLSEYIKHHVREEEKAGGIFAKARKAGLDTAAVGARLQARKAELAQGEESPAHAPLRTVSLHLQDIHPQIQESMMPRNSHDRERDDHGRFMSDDDDDRGWRGRGYPSHSPRARDHDDDDRSYRGRGSQDRDEYGRFTGDDDDRDSRSRSTRSSYDDDDDRGSRGRSSERASHGGGHGGWFGDSESHSQAARQRGRSMSSRDMSSRDMSSRHEGSRNEGARYDRDYDDDRGYRSQSSGRASGGRGHGGWFGDSEGHSEAAERGWESRQGGSRMRSSRDYDDDDDRSYRSRGHSSGYSRTSSGHGGWFGDPEGHAEASRRGWQNRD